MQPFGVTLSASVSYALDAFGGQRRLIEGLRAGVDVAHANERAAYLALATPAAIATKVPAAMGEANTIRVVFFILTFFSIGVLSNFKKLWQEGIGRLAAVYVVSLFGFVIWVGLLISWLFFAGIKPPLAG